MHILFAYSSGSLVAFAEVDIEPHSMITQQDIINAINNNVDEFTSIGGPNFTLDPSSTKVLSVIDHSGKKHHLYLDLCTLCKIRPVDVCSIDIKNGKRTMVLCTHSLIINTKFFKLLKQIYLQLINTFRSIIVYITLISLQKIPSTRLAVNSLIPLQDM